MRRPDSRRQDDLAVLPFLCKRVNVRTLASIMCLPALLVVAGCGGRYPVTVGTGPGGGTPGQWQQLAAGREQTCGIFSQGVAYCWGSNDSGEVGDGTTTATRSTPQLVATSLTFQSVAAGGSHGCGISSGAAFCWGNKILEAPR